MENIVLIAQGGGRYLFPVPDGVTLKEGEKVKCQTRRGITDGTVAADSIRVEPDVARWIGKLIGAAFPLKPVVGRMEYREFEEPAEEEFVLPHKYNVGNEAIVSHCGFQFSIYSSWFKEQARGKLLARYDGGCLNNNDRVKILAFGKHGIDGRMLYAVERSDGKIGLISEDGISSAPEYWTGKVVCTKTDLTTLTVGKCYAVVNGSIMFDDGNQRTFPVHSSKTFIDTFHGNTQFIEYKGE